jgi:hypothetical protein
MGTSETSHSPDGKRVEEKSQGKSSGARKWLLGALAIVVILALYVLYIEGTECMPIYLGSLACSFYSRRVRGATRVAK